MEKVFNITCLDQMGESIPCILNNKLTYLTVDNIISEVNLKSRKFNTP